MSVGRGVAQPGRCRRHNSREVPAAARAEERERVGVGTCERPIEGGRGWWPFLCRPGRQRTCRRRFSPVLADLTVRPPPPPSPPRRVPPAGGPPPAAHARRPGGRRRGGGGCRRGGR